MRRRSSARVVLGALAVLAAVSAVTLLAPVEGLSAGDPRAAVILRDLRIPRLLLAAGVGAALSVSGAIYQGLFRNPLADPFVLGVSGGSALGAVAGIVLRVPAVLGLAGVSACSLGGGLAAAGLVYRIARAGGRVPLGTLLLAGFAVGSVASAVVTILLVTSAGSWADILLWLMGSLHHPDGWDRLKLLAPAAAVAVLVATVYARELNLFLAGEESALQLGVEVERTKVVLLVGATVGAAGAVAAAGMIGFVGLIVPNLVRRLTGPDHRDLVPASAMGGAALVAAADLAARTVRWPAELPIGAVLALVGGPFFLLVLRRRAAL